MEAASSGTDTLSPGDSSGAGSTADSAGGASFPAAAVAGAVGGCLAAVAAAAAVAMYWRQRRSHSAEESAAAGGLDGLDGSAATAAGKLASQATSVHASAGAGGFVSGFSVGATRSGLSPRKHPRVGGPAAATAARHPAAPRHVRSASGGAGGGQPPLERPLQARAHARKQHPGLQRVAALGLDAVVIKGSSAPTTPTRRASKHLEP